MVVLGEVNTTTAAAGALAVFLGWSLRQKTARASPIAADAQRLDARVSGRWR